MTHLYVSFRHDDVFHVEHFRHLFALPLERRFAATLFWTHISQQIPLPVEAGDEHGAAMFVATRLVVRDKRSLITLGRGVSQRFAEATLAELFGATEELDRIIHIERCKQEFHGAVVLVAQRQDVDPHAPILAFPQKQNRRTWPPVSSLLTQPVSSCRHGVSRRDDRRLDHRYLSRSCRRPRCAADSACWCPCLQPPCGDFRAMPIAPLHPRILKW